MRTVQTLIVSVVVLCSSVALIDKCYADPVLGQQVIYRYDSTHEYVGVVSYPLNTTEADLVLFSNGSTWFNSVSASVPTQSVTYVTEGVSDNRWRALDVPDNITYVTGTGSTSFSLNGSAAQLSTLHDTQIAITVKVDLTLTLIAGMGGTVHLFCDASSTPTTEVDTLAFSHGLGIATTFSGTGSLRWAVPKSHYCKVTTTNDTGTPSFTVVRQLFQTMGPG